MRPLAWTGGIIAAALGGGAWGLLAGWLKVKRGVHEVIATIMLNFIVDKDPEASADGFIKAVTAFAKSKGVKVEKAVKDINSKRETIALVSFNVTNPQKGVIDEALDILSKQSKMTESEAIAEVCSQFINILNGSKPQ
jgi:hypothetical protein